VLSRFTPAGSWQVVLLRGTGAEPSIDADSNTVKAAIQTLRAIWQTKAARLSSIAAALPAPPPRALARGLPPAR
jgi:hypothetical protein